MKSYEQLKDEFEKMHRKLGTKESQSMEWMNRFASLEKEYNQKSSAMLMAQVSLANATESENANLSDIKANVKSYPKMTADMFDVLHEDDFIYLKNLIAIRHFPQKNKDGQPIANHIDNYIYFFGLKSYVFRFNQLLNKVELNGKVISDLDDSILTNQASRYGLAHKKNLLIDAYTELASKNSYHPFKEIIESVGWDGRDHIGDLFRTIQIDPEMIENLEIYHTYLRRWLIGAIAKVYKPGSQNLVLLLKGNQGIGKSKWLERFDLAPGIYSESPINPSDKDHRLKHLYTVIWATNEFNSSNNRSEINALKDFLTISDIRARGAYNRHDTTGKSVCSFVGTTNDDYFLKDDTGERRFLVIPISNLDQHHQVNVVHPI